MTSLPGPKHWREQFLAQDPILVAAISKLAEAVLAMEPDHAYAPAQPRAVIVGGYVRDLILGKKPKDADVEVYGVAPEQLKALVSQLFGPVDIIGQSFGVLKVMLTGGFELDVAIPRKEAKVGQGHKGFIIESDPGLSFRAAARRRDFTVNAIALDPLTGLIHDPYDGVTDLANDVLRVVDEATFQEDPLRVFRAVQLSARLEATIEPKTLHLLKQMVQRGQLDELSKERVTDEWKKLLLKARYPSKGLELMLELGIIDKYYPELKALIATPQEPEWHPEGNVWIHTGMVIDQAAHLLRSPERSLYPDDALTTMLSALCHDFGKALTTHVEDGRIRSKGHEAAGEAPARSFCANFTFSHDTVDQVVKITRDHLKTTRYWQSLTKGEIDEKQYANILRRLLRRLAGVPVEVFLTVTEADKRGRGVADALTAPYTEGEVFRATLAKFDLEAQAKTPLVSGGEIIAKFSLTPGPRIGALIQMVEAARDEGQVATPEEALTLIAERLQSEV
ncbi:MAG: HD domain-containing protein [Patescibacteria group bacterium]